jgi:hypothetical protein
MQTFEEMMLIEEQHYLTIVFAEHIGADRIASLISSIAAYGDVILGKEAHTYEVSMWRRSKLQDLKEQLVSWEQRGIHVWHDQPDGRFQQAVALTC